MFKKFDVLKHQKNRIFCRTKFFFHEGKVSKFQNLETFSKIRLSKKMEISFSMRNVQKWRFEPERNRSGQNPAPLRSTAPLHAPLRSMERSGAEGKVQVASLVTSHLRQPKIRLPTRDR